MSPSWILVLIRLRCQLLFSKYACASSLQLLLNCTFSPSDSIEEDPEFGDTTIFYDWKECSTVLDQSVTNNSIIIPESLQKLSDGELRKELQNHGEIPGPIMPSTRNVYLKRLARLQSGATYSKVLSSCIYIQNAGRGVELESFDKGV